MGRIELSDQSQEDYLEYRVIHEDDSEGFASLTVRELEGHHLAYQLREEPLPQGTGGTSCDKVSSTCLEGIISQFTCGAGS